MDHWHRVPHVESPNIQGGTTTLEVSFKKYPSLAALASRSQGDLQAHSPKLHRSFLWLGKQLLIGEKLRARRVLVGAHRESVVCCPKRGEMLVWRVAVPCAAVGIEALTLLQQFLSKRYPRIQSSSAGDGHTEMISSTYKCSRLLLSEM